MKDSTFSAIMIIGLISLLIVTACIGAFREPKLNRIDYEGHEYLYLKRTGLVHSQTCIKCWK